MNFRHLMGGNYYTLENNKAWSNPCFFYIKNSL